MIKSSKFAGIVNSGITKSRNNQFDNVRFFLMFLVLMGHGLELFEGETRYLIYRVIYTFHMPAFIFITGYFARFDLRKILRSFLLPYIIMQIAYLLICGGETIFTLQFTTPYWLLWYFLAITFYYLLIPFLDYFNGVSCLIVVLVTVMVSLWVGHLDNIGHYLTLSRFFTYLPFFTTAHYLSQQKIPKIQFSTNMILKILLSFLFGAGIILSVIWIQQVGITPEVLYGSFSYSAGEYGPIQRLLLLITASCWIGFLLLWIPNVRIPLLTFLGHNTFLVFILHGFIIRVEEAFGFFHYSEQQNVFLAVLNAFVIYLILGNANSYWKNHLCRVRNKA